MKDKFFIACMIFFLLGTINFIISFLNCDLHGALPSMLFASFWIIIACKTKQWNSQ
jgi:hypothetical protein